MSNLFVKDQNVLHSPPVVGYEIMRFVTSKKRAKTSIFDVADRFKDEPWFSVENLYFGVIFLFAVGLIEFQEPYLVPNVAA